MEYIFLHDKYKIMIYLSCNKKNVINNYFLQFFLYDIYCTDNYVLQMKMTLI